VTTLSGAERFVSGSVPGYGFVVADLLA